MAISKMYAKPSAKQFIEAWQTSTAVEEVAKKLRMRKPVVRSRACRYRQRGVILGVNVLQVTDLLRRHRLGGKGEGKARRYTKETVARLCDLRMKGASIKTCNLHLAAMKSF